MYFKYIKMLIKHFDSLGVERLRKEGKEQF